MKNSVTNCEMSKSVTKTIVFQNLPAAKVVKRLERQLETLPYSCDPPEWEALLVQFNKELHPDHFLCMKVGLIDYVTVFVIVFVIVFVTVFATVFVTVFEFTT